MYGYWKKEFVLLVAIAISAISAFVLLCLIVSFSFFATGTKEESMLIGVTLPSIISLYVLPKLCRQKLIKESDFNENSKQSLIAFLFLVVFAILYGLMFWKEFESITMLIVIVLHYTVVGLGEEFTYRKFILEILELRYKRWVAISISATMFSFILHINEDFMVNLIIRLPMGLVFGYIAAKFHNVTYTIVLHTIYDLVILVL